MFQVVAAGDVRLEWWHRQQNLKKKLKSIESCDREVDELVAQRRMRHRVSKRPHGIYRPHVKFLDKIPSDCSVVEVSATDRSGLLYDLATALAELQLNVHFAKGSTMSDRARDVFYVLETTDTRVNDSARRKQIATALEKVARHGQLGERKKGEPFAPQVKED